MADQPIDKSTEVPQDFEDLGLPPQVLRALKDVGYEAPSPIQAATIPHLMAGEHVVGLAQTGTGKTAAFALPILSRIDVRQHAPQALVLAPTRELALQVAEAFERYAAHLPVRVLPVYGGQGYGVQLSALRRGVHIVVGTPGRVMDHLDKGTLDLSEVRYVVLDEADEMLNMGFAEDVERILADTPEEKQLALFSATMPAQIKRMTKKYAAGAIEIKVAGKTATAPNVAQHFIRVAHHRKLDALTRILEVENFEAMIVFVRTKQATEELAERLRARGFSAAAINGDVVQNQRERTINQLRDGKLDVLVATDVAARGLDVERITHVINHDIPTDNESYVHRIGRTGRAGRSGTAISFVTPRENHLLRSIEKTTRQPMTEMAVPTADDVNATRVQRFTEAITQALADSQVDVFRELIGAYQRDREVEMIDVAAAIAVLAQDGQPLLLEEDLPEPPRTERKGRKDSADHHREHKAGREGGREGGREERRPRRQSDQPMARYRIAVGRRQRVEPRQIVGALANEGGLSREDFGRIDISVGHSIVELPERLPEGAFERLRETRISGVLIDLRREDAGRGPKSRHEGGTRPRSTSGPRRDAPPPERAGKKKPRHKPKKKDH